MERQMERQRERQREIQRKGQRKEEKPFPGNFSVSSIYSYFFFFRGKGNDTNQMKTLNFKLVCIFETLNNVKEKTFCYKKTLKRH
jgi:hypothetical protein